MQCPYRDVSRVSMDIDEKDTNLCNNKMCIVTLNYLTNFERASNVLNDIYSTLNRYQTLIQNRRPCAKQDIHTAMSSKLCEVGHFPQARCLLHDTVS